MSTRYKATADGSAEWIRNSITGHKMRVVRFKAALMIESRAKRWETRCKRLESQLRKLKGTKP